jgi:antitoxin component HigA of HigAB toxin-antitoxin module
VRKKSGTRPVKTEQQYRRYLKEVNRLVRLDPAPRTAQGVRLQLLAKRVEDYEKKHFKFTPLVGEQPFRRG